MKNRLKKFLPWIIICSLTACTSADKTTGFGQELHTQIPINTGVQRSGEQVYEYRCKGCHARNTQGAPMPGDHYDWHKRYQKGMAKLMEHTVNGYNRGYMPPRGGCKNCSELELKAAVIYMLNNSGINVSRQ